MTDVTNTRTTTAEHALHKILAIAAKATAPNLPQPAVETLTPGPVMDAIVEGATPLRAWCEHRGFNQQELASLSGVHKQQIYRYMNGTTEPSARTLRRLARALNTTMENLMDDDGEPIPPIPDTPIPDTPIPDTPIPDTDDASQD